MFILHSSNKTENLRVHLVSILENVPLSDPFTREVFVIQSQGMERWLSQQLTDHFGVWGNYEFLFPSTFFRRVAKKMNNQNNESLFNKELMLWRFELLLRDLDDECFQPLQHYLNGENKELKRYQLARQLAHIFDQYQTMRPDMLSLWQQGKLLYQLDSEKWQRALWLQIIDKVDGQNRAFIWQDIIIKLNAAQEGALSKHFPERIFIFGLNTLPPLFLDYLQALSRHCDIHLFLLNPAHVYWANLANKKQRIIEQDEIEDHPLLSTLGQQGREFQQMLLEQAHFSYEPESFEPSPATNNLQYLQNDILNNQPHTRCLTADYSISLHACHSRMREVEVLKDQLLLALEDDVHLELRDIIVMAPDIQDYAPFISAVFNDIQHAVADRSLRLSNTSLDAFIRFLKLSQSRFGWQSVMDLLEQSVVFSHFDLSEADLELIKHWVSETHVRWGKSAAHRKELGLPELNEHTWQATLERLLMGYAINSEHSFVDDILPYSDIEGSSAQALGGFNDFIQLLFQASQQLQTAMTLSKWHQQLYEYADQLLSVDTQTEQMQRQQLNELLEELAESAELHTESVTLEVIIAWLESRLSDATSSTGFLRGQLTFCSILPMRSIPFKLIALLGLNDGEFPKIDHYPSFDLIGQNLRQGDRSRRADDRYQFLEVLLSARQQIIMTYIGQSIAHNKTIPPSIVISELLEVLESHYQLTDLITTHPLHAFSRHYFTPDSSLTSFSQADCDTAMALQAEKSDTQHWWQGRLEKEPTDIIAIDDLFAFYRHPQKYFLEQILGIRYTQHSADVEEREPFSINRLDTYIIHQKWINFSLNKQNFSLKKLQAQGQWLSGISGELEFNRQEKLIDEFVTQIKGLELGENKDDIPIDIKVGSYRLVGTLGHIVERGSLFYRYADLKGKDFMLAWLHHLMINQFQPQNTYLLSKDSKLIFSIESAQQQTLTRLIEIYQQGQQQPDVFFTETSFAYIQQASKLKTSQRAKKPAIVMAENQLDNERGDHPSLRQLYQNVDDLSILLNEEFKILCEDFILPVWEKCHQ